MVGEFSPLFIVFDNGGEFKRELKKMCKDYGIIHKRTTNHIHQRNSKIEITINKSVNDMFRLFDWEKSRLDKDNTFDYFH
jgi:hypothetical protein